MDLRCWRKKGEPSAGGSDLGDTDTRGPPHRKSLSGVTERFYIDLPKRESAVSEIFGGNFHHFVGFNQALRAS